MKKLTSGQKLAVQYHDLFDYPLTEEELYKWASARKERHSKLLVIRKQGYYLLKGREKIIARRRANEIASKEKLQIAGKAANILSKIPTVKMVAISGALAMVNASESADIDLLIITATDTLWSTRPLVYLLLKLNSFSIRQPKDPDEKDKLCLNLWMDETNLKIVEKNIYTAHELVQLVPLVDKDGTYEKLMRENNWVKDYWPYALGLKIQDLRMKSMNINGKSYFLKQVINQIAFKLQYQHMKSKITREQVSTTRAFFHPKDWGKEIEKKLTIS